MTYPSPSTAPQTNSLTRRTALAAGAAALAGGAAVNVVAIVAAKVAEPDPIFAVIEAHRTTWAALAKPISVQGEIEQVAFDTGKSRDLASDPRWIAIQQTIGQIHDAISAAEDLLVEVTPTTIAGLVALLKYVAEHTDGAHCEPEGNYGGDWMINFHCHVAAALESIHQREVRS